MSLHSSRIAATIGAAFLLTTIVGAPAQAMVAPFDPAPTTIVGAGMDKVTPHCFMGHERWPAAMEPQVACTA